MSAPTEGDWARPKHPARYLRGRPRAVHCFKWQSRADVLNVFSDADWAGNEMDRRSTTGGCVTLGQHWMKVWSKTQTRVALSSGESEFYAALKASAEGLGIKSIAHDLGMTFSGEVWGDASAALGIIKRKGLGCTRHIDTGFLWIQQTAAEKRLSYHKVLGRDNPADLMTKYLDQGTIDRHSGTLNMEFPTGPAATAPTLHYIALPRSLSEAMADAHEDNGK